MSSPASAASDMVRVFVFFMNLDNPVKLIGNAVQNVTENAAQGFLSQCFETLILENAAIAGPSAVYFNNEIYMFYQNGGTGQLWYNVFNGSTWGTSTQLAGVGLTGSPSAVVFNNEIYVFYQSDANGEVLYYSVFDGTSWADAVAMTNRALSNSPSAVEFNGKLYVFYQSSALNGDIYYSVSSDGSDWGSTDTQMASASMSDSPSATVLGSEVYVFYQGGGNDQSLYYSKSADGSSWTTNVQVSNVGITASPTAIAAEGNIYVFHLGKASGVNQLWLSVYNSADNSWSADTQIAPLQMTDSPSAVSFNGSLYYFNQGPGISGVLWCTVWNGTSVTAMYALNDGNPLMSCTPGPVVFNDELYVFYQGPGANGRLYYMVSSDGLNWGSQQQVPGAGLTDSPSAVVFNGKLYVFYQGEGNSDWLWYSVFDGSSWSSSMGVPDTGLYYAPSAVVFNDKLYVFVRGWSTGEDADMLWCNTSTNGTNWNGSFAPVMGAEESNCFTAESPAAVVFNGKLYVFSGDYDSPNQLQYITSSNGSDWSQQYWVASPSTSSENAPSISAWPAAAVFGDTLYVLFQSSDTTGRLGVATSTDGSDWSIPPQPATDSAQYPFGTMFTLTQAEYNALTAVTDD